MAAKGLIIVNTGNGKGKTTAAFGQALRAAGQGFPVCIIQFIKGKWQTGETRLLGTCSDLLEIHTCGTGFTWDAQDMAEVVKAARLGWEMARAKISSGLYKLVVLDELTYLLSYGIIAEEEVLAALAARPPGVNIVITGRGAGETLIAAADIVTEMREVKHCFNGGITAGKGIEF